MEIVFPSRFSYFPLKNTGNLCSFKGNQYIGLFSGNGREKLLYEVIAEVTE